MLLVGEGGWVVRWWWWLELQPVVLLVHSCNLQQGCSLTEICNEFCSCKYHQFTIPPSLSLPYTNSPSLHLFQCVMLRHIRERERERYSSVMFVCLFVCVCFNTIVIVTIPPPPILLCRELFL